MFVAGAVSFAWLTARCILPAGAAEVSCASPLDQATRLVLVTTATMKDTKATLQTFERDAPSAPWKRRSGPEPVVVGKAGLGWGLTFRAMARPGEPLKREGDGRAPAGIFPIGAAFGFAPASLPGYLQLKDGVQFCVDDPGSPHYSQIVTQEEAGPGVSGEDMPAIPLYKRGVIVDYPTSGPERGGSCSFIHIWRGKGVGTAGCVAGPEAMVADLQGWAGAAGKAAIAILPQAALGRFGACLPAPE